MNRRKYLSAIGLAAGAGLAGCSGGTGGNNSSGGSGSSTPAEGSGESTEASGGASTTTMSKSAATSSGEMETRETNPAESTSMPTSMRTPSTARMTSMSTSNSMGGGSAGVSIDSSEFAVQNDSGYKTAGIEGTLTAPRYLSSIELAARFRDNDGNILDNEPAYFTGLEKGETWNFYIESLASSVPSDGEVEIVSTTAGSPPSNSGAKVIDSSLNEPKDEYSGPTVTATVKNTSGSSIGYLEADVKYLADDGTALESDYDNISDLPAGETWKFSLEALTVSTDPRPDIADYDITLASGMF